VDEMSVVFDYSMWKSSDGLYENRA